MPKALPDLGPVSYKPTLNMINFKDKILLCGDHTANSSLNAAMLSGELASKRVLDHLKRQDGHIN